MVTGTLAIRLNVTRFFRWWLGELESCLPRGFRRGYRRSRQRLVVEMTGDAIRILHARGRELRQLGEIPVGSEDNSGRRRSGHREAVAQILRRSGLRSTEVTVLLPRDRVLRRQVELPAATAENLREVLGFEMDRHTPFKAQEVYFDHRIESRDPARKRIKVDLVVVPRAVVDQARNLAASWGLTPDRIGVSGAEEGATAGLNLLPADARRMQGRFSQRLMLALALMAAVLGLLAFYVPLHQKQARLAATEATLERVRAEALQADALKTQVEENLGRSQFVVERKLHERSATEVLNEVTRLLPDHTWVLKFSLRQDQLNLSGYSARPSALIGILEQSEMFAEVRFSSPVTLDQRVGLERFNLIATLVAPSGT